MSKICYALLALAAISIAISFGGKWVGRSIANGGHTDSTTLRTVTIAANTIIAPDNMIRFAEARQDGAAARLDLYLRWPDLDGYAEKTRDDFNHRAGSKNILFLVFEERSMSRDMSGRYAPIYEQLIDKPGRPGSAGLTIYDFSAKSGYTDETLVVAARLGGDPFVARCLGGKAAEQSLAPCERDIHIGDNLSLTYRFPPHLLPEWQAVEAAVRKKAVSMLKAAR